MKFNGEITLKKLDLHPNQTLDTEEHLCLKCNTNFVYYDGWHCKCETTESLQKIINDTLRELPVGNISTHTPESIPERVQDWVKEAAEECRLREQWEELADRLIVYAKEIQSTMLVTTTTSALYEAVCQDIEKYKELKNETQSDE